MIGVFGECLLIICSCKASSTFLYFTSSSVKDIPDLELLFYFSDLNEVFVITGACSIVNLTLILLGGQVKCRHGKKGHANVNH